MQKQLKHSSIQITVNIYKHLIPNANHTTVDRLNALPIRIPNTSEDDQTVDDNNNK